MHDSLSPVFFAFVCPSYSILCKYLNYCLSHFFYFTASYTSSSFCTFRVMMVFELSNHTKRYSNFLYILFLGIIFGFYLSFCARRKKHRQQKLGIDDSIWHQLNQKSFLYFILIILTFISQIITYPMLLVLLYFITLI